MADQNTNWSWLEYSDTVIELARQKKSKLEMYCIHDTMTSDVKGIPSYTANIDVTEKTALNQRIVPTQSQQTRRKLTAKTYYIAMAYDLDAIGELKLDPSSYDVTYMLEAIARKKDKSIADSLYATVYEGEAMDSSVSFATDGGKTVDATSGLTYEKFLEITRNFNSVNIGLDNKEFIGLGITEQEHSDLMQELEFTSHDFTRLNAIDENGYERLNGYSLIKFASAETPYPILPVASSTRDCFAFANGFMRLATKIALRTKEESIPLTLNSKMVTYSLSYGCVRQDGRKIQKVQTTAI